MTRWRRRVVYIVSRIAASFKASCALDAGRQCQSHNNTVRMANFIILENLHESSLQTAESNLMRHTLVLSEQTDRSFKSLDLALSSVGDYLAHHGANDRDSYNRIASTSETFLFLKEKITGLPQVEAVSLIDAQGKILSFSRFWPPSDFSVSDRDFFQALSLSADIESFIAKPTRSRVDGSQVIFLARRLSDPNGEFLGVILGAISRRYLENFLAASSLGEGARSLSSAMMERCWHVFLKSTKPNNGPTGHSNERSLQGGSFTSGIYPKR